MHDLARLSATERHHIVTDFVEDVFDGLDADPGIVERMRMAMPELPEEPTTEQVEAWIELVELVGDPDFRGRVRAMAQRSADDRAEGGSVDVRAATESPASVGERERHGKLPELRCRPASTPRRTRDRRSSPISSRGWRSSTARPTGRSSASGSRR